VPISMHVSAISTLLIEKRAALQRLLDLYLSGEFHKDMLIDKKSELERAIGELERERSALLASLRAHSLSEQQEQALMDFARKISMGLDCADSNFQARRAIIEAAGVEVTLYPEQGAKKVQFECKLGSGFSALSPIAFKELAL
jgi:hypothetical protein